MKLAHYGALLALAFAFNAIPCPAQDGTASTGKRSKATDAFFADPTMRVFELKLSQAAVAQLAQSPRTYVTGELKEGQTMLSNVGIRLKGEGSFRTINQKPSFAI